MADHPLRSAIHRCLGEPLPHQQANGPRAHLWTIAFMKRPSFTSEPFDSVVLSGISTPFEELSRIQRQVAHVLLTRSPLYLPEGFLVRLACVRHAASVRSEPGSNSPIDISIPKRKMPRRFPGKLPIPLGSIGNCTTTTRARSGPSHILFFFQRSVLLETRRKNHSTNG